MLNAKNRTGLVFFPAFDWAIDPTHPEREERLLYTQDQVFEEGLLDIEGIVEYKPDIVTWDDINRVHFCVPTADKVTTHSHLISAGGAVTIANAVMEKRVEKGFALVRPPGHHAMRVVHGGRGFCNINIEAIMIEYLRKNYPVRKVAVIDTDCHHGDGTQDIYWHDADTLFISIHQDGRTLYPGSGFPAELGGPNAVGKTINVPLPPKTSDEGYLYVVENLVLPILEEFKPDIVINSAGQDNHFTDPLTNMNFTAKGYADLTTLLNPDIAVLEGGYSIEAALPYVNTGIILAMAGLDYSKVIEPERGQFDITQSSDVTDQIRKLTNDILRIWKHREELQVKLRADKTYQERDRRIMYDTDNIYETQHETIRICDDCNGVLKIESNSDRGFYVMGIHVPLGACDVCSREGLQWYDSAVTKGYDYVYLQDRNKDRYITY